MSALDAALALAARGLPIHPIRPRSKKPILEDWPNKATAGEVAIRSWSGAGTWAIDANDESICVAIAIKGRSDFALGDETFTNQDARSGTWTSGDHDFAASHNLAIVALSHEDNLTASAVALDPDGANVTLTRIARDTGSGTNSVVDFWGVYSASGLGINSAAEVVATIPGGIGAAAAGGEDCLSRGLVPCL